MSHKTIGFFLGLTLFLGVLALPEMDSFQTTAQQLIQEQHLTIDARMLVSSMRIVLALLILMVVWWLTEAIPLAATALLPAVILPWFHIYGVHEGALVGMTMKNILVNYANPVIYLFLGGFLLAGAMQKWKLDRRFTLWFLTRGTLANDAHKILFGIMLTTAFLSMWISNTATAAMMLPLGLGILKFMGETQGESSFKTAIMLGIAWAASIGGIGTIIGTPPNGIALGILNTTFADDPAYERITFLDWMKFGVPYVLLFLPIAWYVLIKLFPPQNRIIEGGKETLLEERKVLGPLSAGEKGTVIVFLGAVVCWVSNPFWSHILPNTIAEHLTWVDEYAIGLGVGALLFLMPVNLARGEFVLNWKDTHMVDWGILILFGGGIALSDAMFKTGVASWIATSAIGILGSPSTLVMLFVIVLLVDLLTEVTSNTAVTTMFVPIIISVAIRAGENPVTLAVAAAIAASMAFMLPVATPPNALVFASGTVRLRDMIRAGVILDMLGWVFTVGVIVVVAVWMFGVLSL